MLMLAQRADMQPIDAHNRALKAPATPEADRTARLQQQFGAEGLLTLAFLARTRGLPSDVATLMLAAGECCSRPAGV